MKKTWEIKEDVHVDMGDGDRRITCDFAAGEVEDPNADDLLALEHLESQGLAKQVNKETPKTPAKASAKEDDHATQ